MIQHNWSLLFQLKQIWNWEKNSSPSSTCVTQHGLARGRSKKIPPKKSLHYCYMLSNVVASRLLPQQKSQTSRRQQ